MSREKSLQTIGYTKYYIKLIFDCKDWQQQIINSEIFNFFYFILG